MFQIDPANVIQTAPPPNNVTCKLVNVCARPMSKASNAMSANKVFTTEMFTTLLDVHNVTATPVLLHVPPLEDTLNQPLNQTL